MVSRRSLVFIFYSKCYCCLLYSNFSIINLACGETHLCFVCGSFLSLVCVLCAVCSSFAANEALPSSSCGNSSTFYARPSKVCARATTAQQLLFETTEMVEDSSSSICGILLYVRTRGISTQEAPVTQTTPICTPSHIIIII